MTEAQGRHRDGVTIDERGGAIDLAQQLVGRYLFGRVPHRAAGQRGPGARESIVP
jgi:hypothetical protein